MAWRAVDGYQNYEVSDDGRVRRFVPVERAPAKELRHFDDGKGYRRLVLRKDGRSVSWKVHRLVAMAFVPNPLGLPQVNHKNGQRSDNRRENLEWVTNQGNARHSFDVLGRKGNAQKGEANGLSKLTDSIVRRMRAMRGSGMTFKSIGLAAGVSKQHAHAVCIGKAWRHT